MPKVDIAFDEQAADFREREVSLKLLIKNSGDAPIEIRSISPRIPEGAQLVETKDFSLLAPKALHTELCRQLTHLANDVLLVSDQAFRARLSQIHKESLQSMISDVSGWLGFFRLYFQMLSGRMNRNFEEAKRREAALLLKVENSEDAQSIFCHLIKDGAADQVLKTTFLLKIDKLRAVEKDLGQGIDVEAAPIATIEPDSLLTATYVISFRRNWLNPSQFSVSVETTYEERGNPARHNQVTTKLISISPSPVPLTLVAMMSAALGVALKHLIPQAATGTPFDLVHVLPAPELLGAVILALVFFNVFEFTSLLKNMRASLGWRSALLLGVLSGLGSDRIFNALKALLGT